MAAKKASTRKKRVSKKTTSKATAKKATSKKKSSKRTPPRPKHTANLPKGLAAYWTKRGVPR